jgi:hypothetical protein
LRNLSNRVWRKNFSTHHQTGRRKPSFSLDRSHGDGVGTGNADDNDRILCHRPFCSYPCTTEFILAPLAGPLFIFYLAVNYCITSPVCITVFTLAAIVKSKWRGKVWITMRLSVAVYLAPFIFVIKPEFLMQESPLNILMYLLGVAIDYVTYLFLFPKPTNVPS